MRNPGQVLALLRTSPASTCAAWGFICRGLMLGGPIGGGCTLTCTISNGVYQLNVAAGAGDWFIPFAAGAARYCDVPRGQPNGTLVVTFPMNGCALEVHSRITGNRFYHDSDGIHMPNYDRNFNTAKSRVDVNVYEGVGARAAAIFARYPNDGRAVVGQNFEHTLICVMQAGRWHVYQTAVVTTINTSNGALSSWQIKEGPPVSLGSFAD
jgi:hypothetical protein